MRLCARPGPNRLPSGRLNFPSLAAQETLLERASSRGRTLNELVHAAQPRRHFFRLMAMTAASAVAPWALYAEQGEAGEPATSLAGSAGLNTFEDVWRTVRDR